MIKYENMPRLIEKIAEGRKKIVSAARASLQSRILYELGYWTFTSTEKMCCEYWSIGEYTFFCSCTKGTE